MAIQVPKRPSPATDGSGSDNSGNGAPSAAPPVRRASHPPVKTTFVRATAPTVDRIIASLWGAQKSGKSTAALTAPGPIYYHSFDIGLDGVVQKFQDEKEIYVAEYELEIQPGEASPQQVAESASRVWEQFVANYRDSLVSCGSGTVVWDTDTEVNELLRLSRFGRLAQVMPHHYAPVNAEFRDLIREAYDHKCNLFLLGKEGAEWINDAAGKGTKTGNTVRKGFTEIPYLTQLNGYCRWNGGVDFTIEIESCRFNPEASGQIVPNNYDMLKMAVFG